MDPYELAATLRDELVVQLEQSLAGPVRLATVHPGDMVPAYTSCAMAAVRIAAITPQDPGLGCGAPSSWDVTLDLVVNRCYPNDPSRTPDMDVLADLAREGVSDAEAMMRAMCVVPDDYRWTPGAWRPVGPQGDVYGGVMQVIVHDLDAPCCP
ncbi:hypothetical protein [Tsukamurella pseudospumae]|uniref:Uncharacterized protein n=1 Tax=Tsukamurella pseudospumae TaxID=239498 RepID=A0A137ZRU4_9ACTN|nr:hypothetical protein [Tsukamurella pseudospumae]KXP00904.1 hypothetical protein AXK61_12915 [Tsukamurella pseudospumae]